MTRSGSHGPRQAPHRARRFGESKQSGESGASGRVPGPTAAERARTLVAGPSSAVLEVPGMASADPFGMLPTRRAVTAEADIALEFPIGSPVLRAVRYAADDELAAVLEITDVAPVAVAGRVRGRAWIAGWLTPLGDERGPGWLKLEVGEVSVADAWGEELVEPDEFAAAVPDLVAECEVDLLQHLAASHAVELRWLSALIDCDHRGGGACQCSADVVPLALDRFGLRTRFTGGGDSYDAFFPFPAPARSVDELRRGLHALFKAAEQAIATR